MAKIMIFIKPRKWHNINNITHATNDTTKTINVQQNTLDFYVFSENWQISVLYIIAYCQYSHIVLYTKLKISLRRIQWCITHANQTKNKKVIGNRVFALKRPDYRFSRPRGTPSTSKFRPDVLDLCLVYQKEPQSRTAT